MPIDRKKMAVRISGHPLFKCDFPQGLGTPGLGACPGADWLAHLAQPLPVRRLSRASEQGRGCCAYGFFHGQQGEAETSCFVLLHRETHHGNFMTLKPLRSQARYAIIIM